MLGFLSNLCLASIFVASFLVPLKRVSQKWKHSAEVHDSDPKEQRHTRNHLGRQRRIVSGSEALHVAKNSGEVKQEHVEAGEKDEKHLEPENVIVDVLKRVA